MVAALLYLFRSIYAEVVGALPLNGGAYNALLNTTSKLRASVAACLTILSYMATAVISASEAMHYAHAMWSPLPGDRSHDRIAGRVHVPDDHRHRRVIESGDCHFYHASGRSDRAAGVSVSDSC